MKHVIYSTLLFTLLLWSCSTPSQEEKAIADYVQRIGTTKTDLSFKMKDLKFIKDIRNQDSLNWYVDNYSDKEDTTDSLLMRLPKNMRYYKNELAKLYAQQEKAIQLIQAGGAAGREGVKVSQLISNAVNRIAPQRERDSLILVYLNKYNNNHDHPIAKQYDAVYTIKNPVLNNVEQELTKTFYLSPDGSQVIRTAN